MLKVAEYPKYITDLCKAFDNLEKVYKKEVKPKTEEIGKSIIELERKTLFGKEENKK